MSWLSDLFGGGGDDQAKIAAAWQQYYAQQNEQNAAARESQQNQAQMDYLNQLRNDQLAQQAKAEAADPTAARTAASNAISGVFTPGYETSAVPTSLTDPLEQAVYGEQRANADEIIQRMLKRGVLTDTGAQAATAELERQAPGVRSQLDKIGQTLLENERSKVSGITNKAREAAANLNVGQGFDVTPYQTEVGTELGDFSKNLSDQFRGGIPGNLFDTSTLASIGGGAQFAGNQPFDPNVTQGIPSPIKAAAVGQDPFAPTTPKRTASVF
jgi:hypothetical protein